MIRNSHWEIREIIMLRREVVEYAEKNDPEYGRCGTCKHYKHLDACSQCYSGSRYCFAWKTYLEKIRPVRKC